MNPIMFLTSLYFIIVFWVIFFASNSMLYNLSVASDYIKNVLEKKVQYLGSFVGFNPWSTADGVYFKFIRQMKAAFVTALDQLDTITEKITSNWHLSQRDEIDNNSNSERGQLYETLDQTIKNQNTASKVLCMERKVKKNKTTRIRDANNDYRYTTLGHMVWEASRDFSEDKCVVALSNCIRYCKPGSIRKKGADWTPKEKTVLVEEPITGKVYGRAQMMILREHKADVGLCSSYSIESLLGYHY